MTAAPARVRKVKVQRSPDSMTNKLKYLVYMLRIRRVEFRIAELPILIIPILLLIQDTSILKSLLFWEGILIFFLLFAFGDMINCLADRDLDAVYKPHLSEAVYGLGVRFVTFQVVATALVALLMSAHLSWRLQRWQLFALVAVGLLLGAAYSVKPIQLKGRGLAQLFCLWLIIFVGPILFISLLISSSPSWPILIFAAAYGALQMGVILVNTAEDYPEDLEAHIKTTIVALGLHRGIGLAFWLALLGSAGVLIILGVLLWQWDGGVLWLIMMLPATSCGYVTLQIWKLRRTIKEQSLAVAIKTVKQTARSVPVWLTLVAWSMVFVALALHTVKFRPGP